MIKHDFFNTLWISHSVRIFIALQRTNILRNNSLTQSAPLSLCHTLLLLQASLICFRNITFLSKYEHMGKILLICHPKY